MKPFKVYINEKSPLYEIYQNALEEELTKWAFSCIAEWTAAEKPHADALAKTGFWGKQGAGCIFYAQDTQKFLVAHRSRGVEQPNTWGTWGGAIDSGENPKDAVRREAEEECGYSGKMELIPLFVFSHSSGFTYHNFLAVIPKEFTPRLDWESQGFKWVSFGDWPTPLHPGLQKLLSDKHSVVRMQQVIKKP